MAYDTNNVFACRKVYEDAHVLAFHDIQPQTPTHVLVIPKGAYVSWDAFSAQASEAEIAALVRAAGRIARDLGVAEGGYRLLSNSGRAARQEVPHLHLHIFAGSDLGRMIKPADK